MNIAIYARVSSESQSKDGTIQSQLEVLREYAKTENLTVVEECIDDGFSGADLNRPGLDRLRDLSVEGVLVLSPDRLARKNAHQIILLEEFKKRIVQVIFTNQQFGDSPEDQLMLQIQGAISEYERAKILDRTRRGTLHSTRQGQVLGSNTPYGYKFVHKTNEKLAHWQVDDREAEIVRNIFDWYVNEGLSGSAVRNRLTEEGYNPRSGRKWWSGTIYDILKNETYTGTAYMYKTKSVEPGKHPKVQKYRKRRKSSKTDRPEEDRIPIQVTPIIEQNTWEKAQKLLKLNSIRSPRNNKKNNYLLRGLAICGLCGSMAPGYVSNKKTYYSCGAKRNKNFTTKPHDEKVSVKHKSLDEKVWSGLVNLLDDPKNLETQISKRLDRNNAQIKPESVSTEKIDKELDKLEIQETRLIDAYRESVIDLEELKLQKAKIANRRGVLNVKIKAVQSQTEDPGQLEITKGMLGDLSARFHHVIANADFSTREKIAKLLVNRVTLYPEKAIVEGNIPLHPDALVQSKHVSTGVLSLKTFIPKHTV